jgi:hypothetical protein
MKKKQLKEINLLTNKFLTKERRSKVMNEKETTEGN